MPKKRSSILEILENLKVEIFAEENFLNFVLQFTTLLI